MESRFSWYIHQNVIISFNYYRSLILSLIISRVLKFLENLAKETETKQMISSETLESPLVTFL